MKRFCSVLISLMMAATLILNAGTALSETRQQIIRTENNTIEQNYVDESGNKVNGPEGYATIEYVFEKGEDQPVKIRYLDKDGNRVMNEAGYAVAVYIYNNNGTIRQVEFYNAEGKRQAIPEGYNIIRFRYNGGKLSQVD